MEFFDERSAEYTAAFQTLLRCNRDRHPAQLAMLAEICAGRPRTTRSVDWGAGTGSLTSVLCARFDTVYAVEPSAHMREHLARAAPSAQRIAGTLESVTLPEPCGVALLSHVLYHVPDHLWGAAAIRCARQLTADGVLMIALKHPVTGCNAMLAAFGAPPYDLYRLAETFSSHPEFTLELRATPGGVATTSLADTLAIARFVLFDRTPDSFTRLPTEDEFVTYVRSHFWDEARGQGGWDLPQVFALVRPNPAWRR